MSSLRAIVLLVALVACVFAQNPQCKAPAGQIDAYQSGMCNCWSGYAPSTADALDCQAHPKCAPAVADLATVQGNAPQRPKTVFAQDTLQITQLIPIVQKRQATWISFYVPRYLTTDGNATEGLQTCGYPGPLWTKTVNGLDCIDVYTASLPWSQNGACGFAKDTTKSTDTAVVYSTNLVTSVVETYTIGATAMSRTSSTTFLISVSFLTKKTFESGTFGVGINKPTDAGVLTKYVVSSSAYDPSTGATGLTIMTAAEWPFQISTDASALASAFAGVLPANPLLQVTIAPVTTSSCSTTSGDVCNQEWNIEITSTGACVNNIQGVYTFTTQLLCRDSIVNGNPTACPGTSSSVNLDLTVGETDLCDSTPIDTSEANSFALNAFSDAAYETAAVQFQTGDTVYWTFAATNDLASIKSITLNTVKLGLTTNSGSEDILYSNGAVQSAGTAVGFTVANPSSGFAAAGTAAVISFSHKLMRTQLPNTVGTLAGSNTEVQIATSAIVDIEYYGNNKKRSVEMDLSEMEALPAGIDVKAIRVIAPELMEAATESVAAQETKENLDIDNGASVLKAMSLAVVALFLCLLF